MTRNLNANDDTFEAGADNVIPFPVKRGQGDSGSEGRFEEIRLAA